MLDGSVGSAGFLIPFAIVVAILAGILFAARRWVFVGVPEIGPNTLGMFRVVFGVALMWIALSQVDLPDDEPAPGASVNEHGLWQPWGWVVDVSQDPSNYPLIKAIVAVALVFFILGLLSRISYVVALGGFVVLLSIAQQYGGSHRYAPVFLILLSLVVVRWGDGFSLDEMIRRWRGRATPNEPSRIYGLGIWLPGVVLGIIWVAAAYAKLDVTGIDWVTEGSVKFHFAEDSGGAPIGLGSWIAAHDSIAVIAAAVGWGTEALFIFHAFFKDWRIRLLAGLLGASLFLGFYLLQGVHWEPWWIALLGLILPWPLLDRALKKRLPSFVVLVDGACPLCRRTARVLSAGDFWNRLDFADVRDDAERARLAPGLSLENGLEEMYAVERSTGELLSGFRAYAVIGRVIPPLWPLALIGRIPPLAALGEKGYGAVARRRRRSTHACVAGECEVSDAHSFSGAVEVKRSRGVGALVGIAGCICLAFLVAQEVVMADRKTEQLPYFTNAPMYAAVSTSESEFNLSRFGKFGRIEFAPASGAEDAKAEAERLEVDERMRAVAIESIIFDYPRQVFLTTPEEAEESIGGQLAEARAAHEEQFGEAPPDTVPISVVWGYFDFDDGRVAETEPSPGVIDFEQDTIELPYPEEVEEASS